MGPVAAAIQRSVGLLPRLRSWLLKQPLFTSTLLPAIPRPIRWTLRKVYFLPIDLADRLLGQRDEAVPPRTEIFTGSVDGFRKSGERLVRHLIRLGGLRSDSRVLDVGCGVGRLALPLTTFLDERGAYDGLDIVESGIKWCNENIAARHANFRFLLADVFNKEYNPRGAFEASEYTFPYPDETFDLVVLISVFTHMLPPDMEHYIAEIARVLKPGGRCFATYFLVNDESQRLMRGGQSSLVFKHHRAPYWLVNTKMPELSVGYDQQYVEALYEGRGWFSEATIHYGGWCGRPPLWSEEAGLGDQDLVVATKP